MCSGHRKSTRADAERDLEVTGSTYRLKLAGEHTSSERRRATTNRLERFALAVGSLMAAYGHPWMLAGPQAADLMQPEGRRATIDPDGLHIAIFREHQHHLRHYLFGWTWQAQLAEHTLDWPADQWLGEPYYMLEARQDAWVTSRLRFSMETMHHNRWICRSDRNICCPVGQLIQRTPHGLPVMILPTPGRTEAA